MIRWAMHLLHDRMSERDDPQRDLCVGEVWYIQLLVRHMCLEVFTRFRKCLRHVLLTNVTESFLACQQALGPRECRLERTMGYMYVLEVKYMHVLEL